MEEILYDTGSLINAYKQRKQPAGYTTILNVVESPKLLEHKLTVNRNMKLVTTDNYFAVIEELGSDFEFALVKIWMAKFIAEDRKEEQVANYLLKDIVLYIYKNKGCDQHENNSYNLRGTKSNLSERSSKRQLETSESL